MSYNTKVLRVCQILFSGLGGHGSVSFSLIDGDKSGLNKHSLIFYGKEDLIEDYKKRCLKGGIKFFYIRKNKTNLLRYVKIFQALVISKPDIIILHNIFLIIPVYIYSLIFQATLLSVEHTPLVKKRKVDWVASVFALILSFKVIILTKSYLEKYSLMLKGKWRKKLVVISNGIDLSKFTAEGTPTKQLIGMISRLSIEKDHKTLIKAFKILSSSNNEIKLMIAGTGDQKGILEKMVDDFLLKDKVEFLGLLDENEIASLLSSLEIYVHSSYSEAMSTSIIQSLASGKPVIAANIEGIKDLIVDNKTGLLFEPCNPDDLASKIEFLLKNKVMREQISINARKYAEEHLSNERMFKSYLKIGEKRHEDITSM